MSDNNYKTEKTKFGTKTSHPSYGTLSFSRATSGKPTSLFGSSIQHKDTIILRIDHAEMTRGLHSDHIYGNNLIVEAEMSYSQFAEAITSMNNAAGVPVTIRYTEKDGKIPKCDFVSKRKQFEDEYKENVNKVMETSQDLIKEITELFKQKNPLKKADKEKILQQLQQLSYGIGSNLEFIGESFNEQMDKTTTEAKAEIESFYQNKINSIANAALVEHKDDILALENPVEINEEEAD